MPYIKRSPVWPDPRVKPPLGSVRLNPGHSVASGLIMAYLMNEGTATLIDSCSLNTLKALTTGAQTWRAGKLGLSVVTPTNRFRNASAIGVPTAYPFSVHAITQATSGNNGTIRHVAGYSDSGTNRFMIGWSGNSTGTPAMQTNTAIFAGTAVGLNIRTHMTGNWVSNTSRQIYVNGVQNGTEATSRTIATLSVVEVGPIAATLFGDIEAAYFFKKDISVNTMLWLVAEPYGMFEPYVRRTFIFLPTTAQFTSGPHTATATGVGSLILSISEIRSATAVGSASRVIDVSETRSVTAVGAASRVIQTQPVAYQATATGVTSHSESFVFLTTATAVAVGVATATTAVTFGVTGTAVAIGIGSIATAATFLISAIATAIGVSSHSEDYIEGGSPGGQGHSSLLERAGGWIAAIFRPGGPLA